MTRNVRTIPPPAQDRRSARAGARARVRTPVYWATTVIIAAESAMGGLWDVLRTDYVRTILEEDLNYPYYVAIIIGVCKLPAAVVLVAPGMPRLKEWVYAGVFFIYSGAVASHIAMDEFAAAAGPLGFAAITAASWATRPEPRRVLSSRPRYWSLLGALGSPEQTRARTIGYWTSTGIITFVLLSGGFADLLRREGTAAGVLDLGYPAYFLTILGIWKLLGTMALLAPRYPRLKEWAYAGAFFNFAGAFTSHAVSGSASSHLLWTGLFTVCTLMSWALRPEARMLTSETGTPARSG
ncbi:DoxX family protein [Streptomyces sp. NPDC055078]